MEAKKNPNLEIGRNSSIYFAIGLTIMLFITWRGLEYKTYDKSNLALEVLNMGDELDEDIPITNLDALPPPPPPPPAAAPDIINIVEDTEEIEETVIESSETNQDDEIADPIDVSDVAVEEVEEEVSVPFSVVENVPVFPGCKGKNNNELRDCFAAKINEHIKKHFKYPESALEMGVHGKVFVLFAVDADGHVSGIKTRGPDRVLEEEAYRIISMLPNMKPGSQRGKPVKVPYSIPIHFQIQN
jgi:protein TonB